MREDDAMPFRPAEILPGEDRFPERSTAGAFLLEKNRVLLERRPDDAKVYPGWWDTPGGHVEAKETPEAALVREMQEELGIRPTRFFLGAVQDDLDHATGRFYRHFVYVIRAWTGRLMTREDRRIRWFTFEEAMKLDSLNPLVAAAWRDFDEKGWLEDG